MFRFGNLHEFEDTRDPAMTEHTSAEHQEAPPCDLDGLEALADINADAAQRLLEQLDVSKGGVARQPTMDAATAMKKQRVAGVLGHHEQ